MDAYADTAGILVASAECDSSDDDSHFCNWLQGLKATKLNSAYAVPTILYGTGSDPQNFQEFSPGSVGKDFTTLTTDDIIDFITEQFGPPSGGPTPPTPTPPAPSPSPVPSTCPERKDSKEGCEADGACEWCHEFLDVYMCTPLGNCNGVVI